MHSHHATSARHVSNSAESHRGVNRNSPKLKGASDKLFPKLNKWFTEEKEYLTYAFALASQIPLDMTNVFRNAFTRWSQTTRVLNFSETTSYDDANIKIGFYNINYIDGVDDVVVGDTVIKLGSNVNSGFIRLIASKYWVLPTDNYMWSWQNGEFDLETAAIHIAITTTKEAADITYSDNQAMQQIYSNANSDNGGCFTMFGSSFLTSLFLGFAFVALLT
ncbi:matrixin protein [Medicago truncatula]|uniref:Matrixin protein n=1 Tax=Medicago truncatula TaxID=3880 RepID=A0A072UDA8_MEDTR|nr:matrixin protein [Medicago truncatula]